MMDIHIYWIITPIAYLLATVLLWADAQHSTPRRKSTAILVSLLALALHTELLYKWIEVGAGQNLSVSNLFSMIIWLAGILVFIAMLRMPVRSLLILIFPLAALSTVVVWLFPGKHIVVMAIYPGSVLHILLGILTFSVQALVVLQALWLVTQNYLLKHGVASKLLDVLPPLETMERLLFQLIALAFVLLTLVLMGGLFAYKDYSITLILGKTLLSIIAWLIFIILLGGRYHLGWRGYKAIRWAMVGTLILVAIFIISILL